MAGWIYQKIDYSFPRIGSWQAIFRPINFGNEVKMAIYQNAQLSDSGEELHVLQNNSFCTILTFKEKQSSANSIQIPNSTLSKFLTPGKLFTFFILFVLISKLRNSIANRCLQISASSHQNHFILWLKKDDHSKSLILLRCAYQKTKLQ